MRRSGTRRSGRRFVAAVTAVIVLALALVGVGGGYLLLRTKGSPRQTAASYLLGWQHGSYAAMDKVSVNVPRSGLAGPLRQADAELGIRSIRLLLGQVTACAEPPQTSPAATPGPTTVGCSWSGGIAAGGRTGARPPSTRGCGRASGSCSAPHGRPGRPCSGPTAAC